MSFKQLVEVSHVANFKIKIMISYLNKFLSKFLDKSISINPLEEEVQLKSSPNIDELIEEAPNNTSNKSLVSIEDWKSAVLKISKSNEKDFHFKPIEQEIEFSLCTLIDTAKYEILVLSDTQWRKKYPKVSMRINAFPGTVERLNAKFPNQLAGHIKFAIIVDRVGFYFETDGKVALNKAGYTRLLCFNETNLNKLLTIYNS